MTAKKFLTSILPRNGLCQGHSGRNAGTPLASARSMHMFPLGVSSGFHTRTRERRHARRSAYDAHVRVETEVARGMDISSIGLAVELAGPVQIGDVVRVALCPPSQDGRVGELATSARVVRINQTARGAVVALLFLDSDSD
jgi:hypothetical protein